MAVTDEEDEDIHNQSELLEGNDVKDVAIKVIVAYDDGVHMDAVVADSYLFVESIAADVPTMDAIADGVVAPVVDVVAAMHSWVAMKEPEEICHAELILIALIRIVN